MKALGARGNPTPIPHRRGRAARIDLPIAYQKEWSCSWVGSAQRNETLLELAKLEFDLRIPAKRYQRKSSPDLGPAHQDFVH
jgi:hypothetical protein